MRVLRAIESLESHDTDGGGEFLQLERVDDGSWVAVPTVEGEDERETLARSAPTYDDLAKRRQWARTRSADKAQKGYASDGREQGGDGLVHPLRLPRREL